MTVKGVSIFIRNAPYDLYLEEAVDKLSLEKENYALRYKRNGLL
jgi:hypothetical protein